jgi:hypothetical protein
LEGPLAKCSEIMVASISLTCEEDDWSYVTNADYFYYEI